MLVTLVISVDELTSEEKIVLCKTCFTPLFSILSDLTGKLLMMKIKFNKNKMK